MERFVQDKSGKVTGILYTLGDGEFEATAIAREVGCACPSQSETSAESFLKGMQGARNHLMKGIS